MIKTIDEIKPNPIDVNSVRLSLRLGADKKFHLKNLGISEKYFDEAAKYIETHSDEYQKWVEKNGDKSPFC